MIWATWWKISVQYQECGTNSSISYKHQKTGFEWMWPTNWGFKHYSRDFIGFPQQNVFNGSVVWQLYTKQHRFPRSFPCRTLLGRCAEKPQTSTKHVPTFNGATLGAPVDSPGLGALNFEVLWYLWSCSPVKLQFWGIPHFPHFQTHPYGYWSNPCLRALRLKTIKHCLNIQQYCMYTALF